VSAIPFCKMHGLGNDFVIIDQRARDFALGPAALKKLADRRYGVGCDQILFLERPDSAEALARYRVVNSDGSPAEHCGNGIRCVARLLARRGEVAGEQLTVEIDSRLFTLFLTGDSAVKVDMGAPVFEPALIPLNESRPRDSYSVPTADGEVEFGAVSMGNPHAVIEVPDSSAVDVPVKGAAFQATGRYPRGVNVGFMQILGDDDIRLRVFERGVGETPACGTGACAAVVIGRCWGRLSGRVRVQLPGGDLFIEWSGRENDAVWMTGPTEFVFEGNVYL
jgi:diaminopimelate epimerase